VSGEDLVDAQPSFDQNNRPAVSFRFDAAGARLFGDYTAANIGQPFAIVLDDEVISAPVIQAHIAGGSGIITGSFTVEESTNLAILLRAGALPAAMTFLEERTIGPELGADSIAAGQRAAVVGLILVAAYILASYGWFGAMALVSLAINMAALVALLSLLGATLTLPGIAGVVLTMGMAVDGNVLIYERIREEIRNGVTPQTAISKGFEKAFWSIFDANITTLIAGIVLWIFGTGAIRGFAVVLSLGIITSMFTALLGSRALLTLMYGGARRPARLSI
jgi:preprotein translocase subunit SecD